MYVCIYICICTYVRTYMYMMCMYRCRSARAGPASVLGRRTLWPCSREQWQEKMYLHAPERGPGMGLKLKKGSNDQPRKIITQVIKIKKYPSQVNMKGILRGCRNFFTRFDLGYLLFCSISDGRPPDLFALGRLSEN